MPPDDSYFVETKKRMGHGKEWKWDGSETKFRTFDQKYRGFPGHELLIYCIKGYLSYGFVYHPDKQRWFRLEQYSKDFYVRVDSEYETMDKWHYVFLSVWTSIVKLWRKAFPKKSRFPNLLPVAMQVMARTIAYDLVPVQPMAQPKGMMVYLDYVYHAPGSQLVIQFPPEPIKTPAVVQLEFAFPLDYADVLIQVEEGLRNGDLQVEWRKEWKRVVEQKQKL